MSIYNRIKRQHNDLPPKPFTYRYEYIEIVQIELKK